MSLLSPAARRLSIANKEFPKPSPRPDAAARQLAQPPAQAARQLDSFTPAPTQRPSPGRPELNPQQAVESYSEPQEAGPHLNPGTGTGVLTLNIATGVRSGEYRDESVRERQAALINETGASIVALQEVDVGTERSEDGNSALDILRHAKPSFEAFFDPNAGVPRVDINKEAPATAIRTGADGTTLYQTPEGTLVTGESFSGDDRPDGVADDTRSTASYGNAIFVGAPNQVTEAYTVALPSSYDSSSPQGATEEQLAALADGKLTPDERTQLGDTNEAIRDDPNGQEPRSALVTRVRTPDGREQTIINVHLTAKSGEENDALRKAQLEQVARIVEAERNGPPAREVVVLGDFNTSTGTVGDVFEDAGLERTVGGRAATGANYDQIWTTGGLDTQQSAQVETEGLSDHEHAGYTVIV